MSSTRANLKELLKIQHRSQLKDVLGIFQKIEERNYSTSASNEFLYIFLSGYVYATKITKLENFKKLKKKQNKL